MFKYSGRFWMDSKAISFWDYPENKDVLFKLLDKINEKMELIYNFKVDFVKSISSINELKKQGESALPVISLVVHHKIDAPPEELEKIVKEIISKISLQVCF